MKKTILAIPGSSRENSVNHLILRFIAWQFKDYVNLNVFSGLATFPHFNPDVSDHDIDPAVKEFRAEITRSDGVIICTPEYVFSLPGTLKNALEWTVATTIFLNKPAALIVASGLGEKTIESLYLIMTTLGARVDPQSTLLIQGARAKFKGLDEFDAKTGEQIRTLVQSMLRTIEAPF
jgi:NAD(P)H-dependent FMN reductase